LDPPALGKREQIAFPRLDGESDAIEEFNLHLALWFSDM
jgi:hypothetical protein